MGKRTFVEELASQGDVPRPDVLVCGLWPNPKLGPVPALTGRSGKRLLELAGLSTRGELWQVCRTTNLFSYEPSPVSTAGITQKAVEVVHNATKWGFKELVFLGAVVAQGRPYFEWYAAAGSPLVFAFSPHPSGVSRWWNDPANVVEAERFWGDFLNPA